jgi:hypothetical protein
MPLAATGGLARRPHRIGQKAGIRGTRREESDQQVRARRTWHFRQHLEPPTKDAFAVSKLKFFLARLATAVLLISSNGHGQWSRETSVFVIRNRSRSIV